MRFDIPLIAPEFPAAGDVADDYANIVASGRFSNFGPYERRFRAGIGQRLGLDGVATFSSATSGLVSAIATLVGRGNGNARILLPSFTFAAAVQAVESLDFVPEFVDIEPRGLGVDPAAVGEALERTPAAALLFANPFGIGSDMVGDWEHIATAAGIPLIIDSAAGFGSEYADGVPLGGRGDAEVFSFHATKALAVGEGGAVTTKDAELAERLRSSSNFGFDGGRESVRWGLNGKLSELHAAIGVRQLDRIDAILSARHRTLDWYASRLGPHALLPNVAQSSLPFLPVVLDEGAPRDEIIAMLARAGVEARAYYAPALHRHPRFADAPHGNLDVTEAAEARILSLPCHGRLTEENVDAIVSVLPEGTGMVGSW